MKHEKYLLYECIFFVTVTNFIQSNGAPTDEEEYLKYIVTTSELLPEYYLKLRPQSKIQI